MLMDFIVKSIKQRKSTKLMSCKWNCARYNYRLRSQSGDFHSCHKCVMCLMRADRSDQPIGAVSLMRKLQAARYKVDEAVLDFTWNVIPSDKTDVWFHSVVLGTRFIYTYFYNKKINLNTFIVTADSVMLWFNYKIHSFIEFIR